MPEPTPTPIPGSLDEFYQKNPEFAAALAQAQFLTHRDFQRAHPGPHIPAGFLGVKPSGMSFTEWQKLRRRAIKAQNAAQVGAFAEPTPIPEPATEPTGTPAPIGAGFDLVPPKGSVGSTTDTSQGPVVRRAKPAGNIGSRTARTISKFGPGFLPAAGTLLLPGVGTIAGQAANIGIKAVHRGAQARRAQRAAANAAAVAAGSPSPSPSSTPFPSPTDSPIDIPLPNPTPPSVMPGGFFGPPGPGPTPAGFGNTAQPSPSQGVPTFLSPDTGVPGGSTTFNQFMQPAPSADFMFGAGSAAPVQPDFSGMGSLSGPVGEMSNNPAVDAFLSSMGSLAPFGIGFDPGTQGPLLASMGPDANAIANFSSGNLYANAPSNVPLPDLSAATDTMGFPNDFSLGGPIPSATDTLLGVPGSFSEPSPTSTVGQPSSVAPPVFPDLFSPGNVGGGTQGPISIYATGIGGSGTGAGALGVPDYLGGAGLVGGGFGQVGLTPNSPFSGGGTGSGFGGVGPQTRGEFASGGGTMLDLGMGFLPVGGGGSPPWARFIIK